MAIRFKGKDKYGRDTFISLDELIYYELYIKLTKDAKMYRLPNDASPAWTTKAGQVVGKLHSYREEDDNLQPKVKGVWFVFKDQNYISYYWKYQSGGVVDWQHIENQLDQEARKKLNWIENWWRDVSNEISNSTSDILYNYIYPALKWGAVGIGTYFAVKIAYNKYKESKERKELANDIAENLKKQK